MAKFFFNFRQGNSFQPDDLGCEFNSVEDAYLSAFSAAQEMWHELLVKREDPLLCAFEVIDDQGRDLFVLPFSEILDACRNRIRRTARMTPRPLFLQQAIDDRRKAQRIVDEVSSTVADARATYARHGACWSRSTSSAIAEKTGICRSRRGLKRV